MIKADKEQIAVGSDLQNYRIEGILGQGGFGVTYRAMDMSENRPVAIKEYFPRAMAIRDPDGTVRPRSHSEEDRRMFDWGLERFRKEILTLAKFTHDNIVPVLYFFETLGTVYMVMPFVEGDSLKAHVKKNRGMTEERLLQIVIPLLSGLEAMHKVGFLHRDIKPDNIFIQHHNGQPLLLDFGATRQAMGGADHAMTVVMTPEYAPLEQGNADSSKQGPWTDIFSMGAVMYWVVTEMKPLSATTRATAMLGQDPDPMPPVAQVARGNYSERLMKAIDHAIRISANDRPQSIAEWRDEMLGTPQPSSIALRNLSGRVAQMAGRRPIPAFDRSSLRSAAPPPPPRPSETPVSSEPAAQPPAAQPATQPTMAKPTVAHLPAVTSQPVPPVIPQSPTPIQRVPILSRAGMPGAMGRTPLNAPLLRPGGGATPQATAQAEKRFVDNGNGTITDLRHRLIGLKHVKCFGGKSWFEALAVVRDLGAGSCNLTDGSRNGDWRLPSKEELTILMEWKESGLFPGVPPFDNFWSKDINPDDTANAWFIGIDSGQLGQGSKRLEHRLWPVRALR
ncbi:MAG: protein kinase [Magnetococcus sp. MYC-9]